MKKKKFCKVKVQTEPELNNVEIKYKGKDYVETKVYGLEKQLNKLGIL